MTFMLRGRSFKLRHWTDGQLTVAIRTVFLI